MDMGGVLPDNCQVELLDDNICMCVSGCALHTHASSHVVTRPMSIWLNFHTESYGFHPDVSFFHRPPPLFLPCRLLVRLHAPFPASESFDLPAHSRIVHLGPKHALPPCQVWHAKSGRHVLTCQRVCGHLAPPLCLQVNGRQTDSGAQSSPASHSSTIDFINHQLPKFSFLTI